MRNPIIKPLYDAKGNHIDDIVKCGNCGEFVCYPTEPDARLVYRYCHFCGVGIRWEGLEKEDGKNEHI